MQAAVYAPKAYLIIHGEVETAPGRFEPGVESSSSHATREDAEAKWGEWCEQGMYDPSFHRAEIREEGPSLGELLPFLAGEGGGSVR